MEPVGPQWEPPPPADPGPGYQPPGAPAGRRPEGGYRPPADQLARMAGRPGRASRRRAGTARANRGAERRFRNLEAPRPPGPILIGAAVVAVLALAIVVVTRIAGTSTGHPGAGSSLQAGSSGTAVTASNHRGTGRTTGPTRPRANAGPKAKARHHGRTSGSHSASQSASQSVSLTPVNADSAGASYTVPGPSQLSVVVATVSGPCWTEVGPGPAGPYSFARTLPPGQIQTFPASGAIWIRLGAPGAARVTVNGRDLVIPGAPNSPFNLTITSTPT